MNPDSPSRISESERPAIGYIGDGHSGGIVINGQDVGLNGIERDKALDIIDKIRAALAAGRPDWLR